MYSGLPKVTVIGLFEVMLHPGVKALIIFATLL